MVREFELCRGESGRRKGIIRSARGSREEKLEEKRNERNNNDPTEKGRIVVPGVGI
jgi:hypothetical protein